MNLDDQDTSLASVIDAWGLAKFADDDGSIKLIRFNSGFIPWRGKQDFPIRMGIAIPTMDDDFGEEWEETLERAEEALFDLAGQSGEAAITLFITEPHYKESLLYVKSEAAGEKLMDALEALKLDIEFQYYYEEDADWQVYWIVADDLDLLPKMDGEQDPSDSKQSDDDQSEEAQSEADQQDKG